MDLNEARIDAIAHLGAEIKIINNQNDEAKEKVSYFEANAREARATLEVLARNRESLVRKLEEYR